MNYLMVVGIDEQGIFNVDSISANRDSSRTRFTLSEGVAVPHIAKRTRAESADSASPDDRGFALAWARGTGNANHTLCVNATYMIPNAQIYGWLSVNVYLTLAGDPRDDSE